MHDLVNKTSVGSNLKIPNLEPSEPQKPNLEPTEPPVFS